MQGKPEQRVGLTRREFLKSLLPILLFTSPLSQLISLLGPDKKLVKDLLSSGDKLDLASRKLAKVELSVIERMGGRLLEPQELEPYASIIERRFILPLKKFLSIPAIQKLMNDQLPLIRFFTVQNKNYPYLAFQAGNTIFIREELLRPTVERKLGPGEVFTGEQADWFCTIIFTHEFMHYFQHFVFAQAFKDLGYGSEKLKFINPETGRVLEIPPLSPVKILEEARQDPSKIDEDKVDYLRYYIFHVFWQDRDKYVEVVEQMFFNIFQDRGFIRMFLPSIINLNYSRTQLIISKDERFYYLISIPEFFAQIMALALFDNLFVKQLLEAKKIFEENFLFLKNINESEIRQIHTRILEYLGLKKPPFDLDENLVKILLYASNYNSLATIG